MELGVHLPLADWGRLALREGAADLRLSAVDLGFTAVAANDHLVWRTPWLDGLTALAAVSGHTAGSRLMTSVALPVIRHPVVLAKALASMATMAQGPIVAGLGAGSSREDHQLAGVPVEQRWARFDEAFRLVRALLAGEPVAAERFYTGTEARLEPVTGAVSVWSASWGSSVRLRTLARDADGWMATANIDPVRFRAQRAELDTHLHAAGRDPTTIGDLVATTWLYVTDDPTAARRMVEELLAPLLRRDSGGLAPTVCRSALSSTARECSANTPPLGPGRYCSGPCATPSGSSRSSPSASGPS